MSAFHHHHNLTDSGNDGGGDSTGSHSTILTTSLQSANSEIVPRLHTSSSTNPSRRRPPGSTIPSATNSELDAKAKDDHKGKEESDADDCQPVICKTDKGAIRFQLPGKIQHKTTIKVTHFPEPSSDSVVINIPSDGCNTGQDENTANSPKICQPPPQMQQKGSNIERPFPFAQQQPVNPRYQLGGEKDGCNNTPSPNMFGQNIGQYPQGAAGPSQYPQGSTSVPQQYPQGSTSLPPQYPQGVQYSQASPLGQEASAAAAPQTYSQIGQPYYSQVGQPWATQYPQMGQYYGQYAQGQPYYSQYPQYQYPGAGVQSPYGIPPNRIRYRDHCQKCQPNRSQQQIRYRNQCHRCQPNNLNQFQRNNSFGSNYSYRRPC